MRAFRYRLNDVVDVVDRIAYAGVFGYALVGEVDFAVCVYGNVLEECVALECVLDVGLCVFVEVDNLSVAAAFVVEYAFVVPSVLVVADELALRVGRKGSLACS